VRHCPAEEYRQAAQFSARLKSDVVVKANGFPILKSFSAFIRDYFDANVSA
jgi:hypothetical protein